MSDPQQGPPAGAPDPEQMTPEQQEMLRQMEEEMRKVRVQDLLAQSVVSILNLSARRIAKEDERDLEQAKLGIDAVRALVDLLEPEPAQEVRNALSQIQMLFAQHAGGDAQGAGGGPETGGEESPAGGQGQGPERGPGGRSSGLWTPGD